ncbi:CHAT domain-containing protein [Phormidesmis priestleyi]
MRPPQIAARFLLTIVLFSALPAAVFLPAPRVVAQSTVSDRRKIQADQLLQQGDQLYQVSRFNEALIVYQQALKLYQQNKDRKSEGIIRINIGLIYERLGQYPKALDYYEQALQITQKVRDRVSEGTARHNIGAVYEQLGQYSKALDYYQQVLQIRREMRDRANEGFTFNNLGVVYRKLGQSLEALKVYQRALRIHQETHNRKAQGDTLNNMGLVYLDREQYPEALKLYQQVLQIRREVRDLAGEGATLTNIGGTYRRRGQYAQALKFYRQGLRIMQEVRDSVGEAYALNNIGATLVQSGQYRAAEQPLSQSIARFEQLSGELKDRDKIALNDAQKPPYRWLQTALIAQNKIAPALEVAERGRTRAFVDLLATRLATNSNQTQALQRLRQPIFLAQIQQVARQQNATLVEYSVVKKDLYIWIVSPSGQIQFRKTQYQFPPDQLQDLVSVTRGALQQSARRSRTTRTPASLAPNARLNQFGSYQLRTLHQLLIEPIADLLPKNPNDRIIFIPQNELLLVPFPALMDAQGNYLIEQHTLSSAPSIQVLSLTAQNQQQLNRTPNRTALVVGNPTLPKLSEGRLFPLPAAEQEARTVAQLLKTTPMIGAEATKAAVLKQMPQARFIHLATHGLLTRNNGEAPGAIVLAPNDPNQVNDGLLTPTEILDMKLKAELVVLSACDTAQGDVTSDGVVGLSRSLVAAGVPSVVVSLWNVSDESTSLLMSEFYRNLQKGSDRAAALRQAMLTTMKHPEFSTPYDWAAFTLIGEAD